jgi:hypothetical protein
LGTEPISLPAVATVLAQGIWDVPVALFGSCEIGWSCGTVVNKGAAEYHKSSRSQLTAAASALKAQTVSICF